MINFITIQTIFKIFLLSHLISNFTPLKYFLESISKYFKYYPFTKTIFNLLYTILTCQKCLSLYIGFILGGFWIGVLSTYLNYLYLKIIAPKIDKIILPKIDFING